MPQNPPVPKSSYPSYGAPSAAAYGAMPNPAPYGAAPTVPGGGAHPPPFGFNPAVVHGASPCKLMYITLVALGLTQWCKDMNSFSEW